MSSAIRLCQKVVLGLAAIVLITDGATAFLCAQTPAPRFTAEQQAQVDYANRLNQHAIKLFSEGKSKEALPFTKQSLEIRRQLLGEDHPHTAASLNNMGLVLETQGQFADARKYYEQALKIRKKILGDNHRDTVDTLNNLGLMLKEQADYAAARPYLEEVLKCREKSSGPDDLQTAQALDNLAKLLELQNDNAKARPYYERVLRIRRTKLGDNHLDTAYSFHNLGAVLHAQGDYAAARHHYEQALKIFVALRGKDDNNTAGVLNNLGYLYYLQGHFEAARDYYEQALSIKRKLHGEEHPDIAISLNSLGDLFLKQRDGARAISYYEQALKITKKAYGNDHLETARTLNSLGAAFQAQGDYAAARSYYEQTLKIAKKTLGDNDPKTAAALNNMAELLREMGEYDAARPYFEHCLRIKKNVLGDNHPSTAVTLNNMMILEWAGGHWGAAMALAQQNRRAVRKHIAQVLVAMSEEEQALFLFQNDHAAFSSALSLALLRRQDPQMAPLSAGWQLNGKGVAQEALAERTLLSRDIQDPKLKPIAEKLVDVRRRLAALALSVPEKGKEAAHREELKQLVIGQANLARELTTSGGRLLEADPWVELSRVRDALPADGVLIDIARFDVTNFQVRGSKEKYLPPRYVAWIIPPAAKGEVQIVDLGPAEAIEAAVESARKSIQAATDENGTLKQQGESVAEKEARQQLQKIADLAWKPLADKLGGAKQVILSPDGTLWLVPWAALPLGEDKVLLEDYRLRYVVSGRDVIYRPTTKMRHSLPVLFADPDFGASGAEVRQATRAVFPDYPLDDLAANNSATNKKTLPRVARLPNTATEAQAIAPNIERFTKAKPQTYTDRNASESVFKRLKPPSLLVLSTHGFFLGDSVRSKKNETSSGAINARGESVASDDDLVTNPLLRCGLLLAGCNSPQTGGDDDGILTGMEILSVDLRGTELVVLSACETGVGKIHNGEGVAGLRQAFQLAGAKSVVATLWQVPDRDSMLIMNDFFQNLADGKTKTDALRSAQLKRIESRRDRSGSAHPFFWAAWTLTGE